MVRPDALEEFSTPPSFRIWDGMQKQYLSPAQERPPAPGPAPGHRKGLLRGRLPDLFSGTAVLRTTPGFHWLPRLYLPVAACLSTAKTNEHEPGWLKTPAIYFLTSLEPEVQSQGVGETTFSPKALGENSFLVTSCHLAPGPLVLISAPVVTWPPPPLSVSSPVCPSHEDTRGDRHAVQDHRPLSRSPT